MASVTLEPHFEHFIDDQIAHGRFKSASEVVEAGLRLLEGQEARSQEHVNFLSAEINAAWDDPSPSKSADEVFGGIEAIYAAGLSESGKTIG
jgi:antitoxin ParD1/3/4